MSERTRLADAATRRARLIPSVYSGVLTLLILGPLLGNGYLLVRDAVSTARSYLTDAALGLGAAAPRAVPQDGLLALLSPIVDGGVLVKAILVLALWAAGYGAAVLARELVGAPVSAQLVACTVALWNPYVAERLSQGHWSLLTGYAALPWTVVAAYRIRTATATRTRHWAALVAALAAAGLTPTGALLAGITALALLGLRRLPAASLLLVAASAPWLTATVLSDTATETSDPTGIAAFAARAEPGLATLGSLAGLGGIWNAEAVPQTRTTPLALIGTLVLLAIVAAGVRTVLTRSVHPSSVQVRRAVLVLAVLAIVLPAFGATAWGTQVMQWLIVRIPGAGLLRDTQKYVALALPTYVLCAAAGCRALATSIDRYTARGCAVGQHSDGDTSEPEPPYSTDHHDRETAESVDTGNVSGPGTTQVPAQASASHDRPTSGDPLAATEPSARETTPVSSSANDPHRADTHSADAAGSSAVTDTHSTGARSPSAAVSRSIAAVFIVLLILPLIDLAWGVGGQVRAVRYPAGWSELVSRFDGPGDVAVLPAGMFRAFDFTPTNPVLDPAPRLLPRDVLQTGELPVRGGTVAGEGARGKTVETLLLHGDSARKLADAGVGWVLVEHRTPGPLGESAKTLAELSPIYRDADLTLYRVPGPVDQPYASSTTQRALAIAAHLLWAALLVGGAITALSGRKRTSTREQP
ncbi:hypothetical protein [Nocardia callitridis]|uniref:hypothetical protein n=1 Tax=Nocardia callitridis TaxID=648753 RepID=UPI0031E945ED